MTSERGDSPSTPPSVAPPSGADRTGGTQKTIPSIAPPTEEIDEEWGASGEAGGPPPVPDHREDDLTPSSEAVTARLPSREKTQIGMPAVTPPVQPLAGPPATATNGVRPSDAAPIYRRSVPTPATVPPLRDSDRPPPASHQMASRRPTQLGFPVTGERGSRPDELSGIVAGAANTQIVTDEARALATTETVAREAEREQSARANTESNEVQPESSVPAAAAADDARSSVPAAAALDDTRPSVPAAAALDDTRPSV
ncbi:MAG: hypothetical protein JW751_07240, partial [Polyangiaceae bacterium]|nr:hypothetical protein [Polyangiaceae bacterium]